MKIYNYSIDIRLRIDQLWLAVILAGFAFYTSLVPIPPNDFWWHLKIGEIIGTQNIIPETNMFAWSIPTNFPFVYGAWLAELLFYSLHKIGGLELLIFLRNIISIITLGLLGYEAHSRSNSWRISAFVTAIAGLMILNNLALRPQIWSWIPFVLYFILLRRYLEKRINKYWLLLLPLIMIFWVNVHGAFILGIVLIAIFLIGDVFKHFGNLIDKDSLNELGWLGFTGLLTIIATVINPRFLGIFSYVIDLMTDAPSQKLVEEWQSPTPTGIPNTIFFVSILLLFAVLSISRFKLIPLDLMLIMAFLWLAWSGQRYVIWYGIISMPVLAEAIGNISFKIRTHELSGQWKNSILALIIFLPVVMVQPWFVEKFPLPDTYWSQVFKGSPYGPLISVNTPVNAVEYLKIKPGGQIFNEMGYGSYMIWSIPEQQVFVDPRVELFPYEQWEDYLKISRSIMYSELITKYQINRIILDKNIQVNLSIALSNDPIWNIEYEDRYSQIWTKNVSNGD